MTRSDDSSRSVGVALLFFIFIWKCLGTASATAQEVVANDVKLYPEKLDKNFHFIPVPYGNYEEVTGISVGLAPLVMFHPVAEDTLSPASVLGLFGMYAQNKSRMGMGFTQLFFNEDRWRLTAAFGQAQINYQFVMRHPDWEIIPYESGLNFGFLQVERRLFSRLYGGLTYYQTQYNTRIKSQEADAFSLTQVGIGMNLSLDKRPDFYYPRNGSLAQLNFYIHPEWMGNAKPVRILEMEFQQYFSLRNEQDVLVLRFYAGLKGGYISFNDQFILGDGNIRGYSTGAHRAHHLLTFQAEYRYNFHAKWGAVGFVEGATLFQAVDSRDNGQIFPSVGAGIRYEVWQKPRFTIGMDVAMGRQDGGLYLRIGTAF
ncbi:BamA/TamA family outer membrane protein [Persicobacter diffluens]